MSLAAVGGPGAGILTPCPVIRLSASRSLRTPTSPRRGAQRTHPHGGHLRALISRYLNERRQARHDAARHRLGGPAPLVGVGIRKAGGRAGPPEDGPKLGACSPPSGGLVISAVHIFGRGPLGTQ